MKMRKDVTLLNKDAKKSLMKEVGVVLG